MNSLQWSGAREGVGDDNTSGVALFVWGIIVVHGCEIITINSMLVNGN